MHADQEENNQRFTDQSRTTVVSYKTHDQNQVEHLIWELTLHHNLTLPNLVATLQQYPNIREQPKLIRELFTKPELVSDMIALLLDPPRMLEKYRLNYEEGCAFEKTIVWFLRENNELYEYYFIDVYESKLKVESWFDFLQKAQPQYLYPALGHISSIFLPFLKYEYRSSSNIGDYFDKISAEEPTSLVIKLFPNDLIQRIMHFTHHEVVFRVIFTLVLVSLQEQEWDRSLKVLKDLCQCGVKDELTLDSHIEHMHWMVREVSNNISNDKDGTIFAFIDAFIQTGLVTACLNKITQLLTSPSSFTFEEETVLQFNLKTLSEIVNIYSLLRRNGINIGAVHMKKLKEQVLLVFKSLGTLLKVVGQFKVMPFSSGEDMRAIGLFRLELMGLVRACLLLVRDYSDTCPQFSLQACREQLLSLVQKYLCENRWNSIMHCQLQKVLYLLISGEFIKSKSPAVHSFMEFLIEAFSNRKYVFLNSTRMAAQGDIYSLYFISRKITNELEKVAAYCNLTKDYDNWRHFIVNSLQIYEAKSERVQCALPQEEEDQFRRHEKDEDFKVEIDQLVSIKEMVKKIEVNEKWSRATLNRSGSASSLQHKPKYSSAMFQSEDSSHKTSKKVVGMSNSSHNESRDKNTVFEEVKEYKNQQNVGESIIVSQGTHLFPPPMIPLFYSHSETELLEKEKEGFFRNG